MKATIAQFSWHRDPGPKGEGELTVEASELGLTPGIMPPDVLEIVSHHTGKTRTFELCGRLIHGGEVLGWSYWDDEEPNIQVKILND